MENKEVKTEKYLVTGMSCAACQAHVEKAVNGVKGVESCSVSLLTNSMNVTGTANEAAIIKAVEDAGYGASPERSEGKAKGQLFAGMEEQLENKEIPVLRNRLISSAIFLLVLMYFSMGVSMWNWPATELLEHNMVGIGIIEMLLSGIVMVINKKFFVNGFKALIHKSTNMDTLVAMGSGISFIYSFVTLLHMTTAGSHEVQMEMMNDLYFESAAMIVTLITIGKLLEAISKGRTTNALKGLLNLQPKTAVLIRDSKEVTVPVEEVMAGDIFVVRPGGAIPVDGIIKEGECAVDESALTGESVPVDKASGDKVSAGTINRSGFITCRAEKVGEDTTLAQIIKMVSESSGSKAPIARIADKVSGIFVPAVLIIAALVLVIWLITGADIGYSLTRAISVLVVSCPCALGLATPVAIMVGNGVAAKNGILFKTSTSLEQTGKAEIIVLDKTGTITSGVPVVTDVIPVNDEAELLKAAYALENASEHPLGKAVTEYCKEHGIELKKIENFKVHTGNGLEGTLEGRILRGGNLKFITSAGKVFEDKAKALATEGKTPLFFETDGKLTGIIAVADTIREDSSEAISELKDLGLYTVMLTGDNKRTAESIGKLSGVDMTVADVLPGDKENIVKKLKEYGKVIMVGDGINDAPALTSADIGIAIGAGTDIAIDAADVVLMKSSLKDAAAAIRISRRTIRNIHENLFWAFVYNVALIPVAAGAYAALGVTMTPMFGAAAMSLSSFTVCMNALRLNLVKPYDTKRDKAKSDIRNRLKDLEIKNEKEINTMEKTIKIEGMMCGHCEASVKKALEALDGVISADVSHDKGTAVVTLEKDVANEVLTKAVEDKDFKVTGIE
ncbi:Cu2+-exporting ATPase [Ruminococcaceae bacterium R-25]|nr:Cu2+-exporting ATPase [Ruminococcaceae bacterium R-25]SUQ11774.1 Cu2+-exporting ATPase [Oscillospiraceae bacterium]